MNNKHIPSDYKIVFVKCCFGLAGVHDKKNQIVIPLVYIEPLDNKGYVHTKT